MNTMNRRGSALMLVLISSVFLIILTGALYTYFKSNTETQMWARERIQAKLTAEAGLNLATHMVIAGASLPTIGEPLLILGTASDPEVLPNGMGSVYVSVDPSYHNEDIISSNAYMINSLATVPGEHFDTYGMQAVVVPLNLARFSVFMDNPTLDGAYVDGYRFDGPFYANGPVRVISSSPTHENDPFFYSFTLTSDYYVSDWGSTHATTPSSGNLQMRPFERLSMGAPYFELGAEPIPFGEDELNWQGVRNAALSGGLYFGIGEPAPYNIESGARIKLVGDSLKVKLNETEAVRYFYLADLDNPVVWFDNGDNDSLYIMGQGNSGHGLDSALTIGMNGHMFLAGDLLYENHDPEDPDNKTLLGLMTINGHIYIASDPDSWIPPAPESTDWYGFYINTDGDFEVDAVLLALEGNLLAEDYHYPTSPGPAEFMLMGGYMIQEEGYTSTNTTGFDISVYFDPRLLSMHPPFFPTTAKWNITMWRDAPDLDTYTVTHGELGWGEPL